MATREEVVIEQALLAMMGACVDLHYELEALEKKQETRRLGIIAHPRTGKPSLSLRPAERRVPTTAKQSI